MEEFFSIILPGMPSEAFERLNQLVIETYKAKGINAQTAVSKLKPEDFPIFDDLYNLTVEKINASPLNYIQNLL